MLQLFGFARIGVVLGDLYFVDPNPTPGQEGAERGARLELRFLDRGELPGSIYSAQPITVGRPIWRADLLESVDGEPGSFDRTHHHPEFREWEPGSRAFDPEMSADPIAYVGARLRDLDGLCAGAGIERSSIPDEDAQALERAVPDILAALTRLLDDVRAGLLARPPEHASTSVRASWL